MKRDVETTAPFRVLDSGNIRESGSVRSPYNMA